MFWAFFSSFLAVLVGSWWFLGFFLAVLGNSWWFLVVFFFMFIGCFFVIGGSWWFTVVLSGSWNLKGRPRRNPRPLRTTKNPLLPTIIIKTHKETARKNAKNYQDPPRTTKSIQKSPRTTKIHQQSPTTTNNHQEPPVIAKNHQEPLRTTSKFSVLF